MQVTLDPYGNTAMISLDNGIDPKDVNLHDIVAQGGKVDDIRKLLKKGAPVDCLNKKGETFLLIHCKQNGDPQMAILALKHGANIHHSSYDKVQIYQKDVLQHEICVPLWCFADSLCKMIGSESEYQGSALAVTTKYEYRKLEAYLIDLLIKEFLANGAKLDTISGYQIRKWMEISGHSTLYLKQVTEITWMKTLKIIFSGELCCSKADRNPKKWNKKVCAVYSTAASLIIVGIVIAIFGFMNDYRRLIGIGGGMNLFAGCFTGCYLKSCNSPSEPLTRSTHTNYGSTYA